MKLSAKTGVALTTITALSVIVTVGAGTSGSIKAGDEIWLGRGPGVPKRVAVETAATAESVTPGDEIWLGRGPGVPHLVAGF